MRKAGVSKAVVDAVYIAQTADWMTIIHWLASAAGWAKFLKLICLAGILI